MIGEVLDWASSDPNFAEVMKFYDAWRFETVEEFRQRHLTGAVERAVGAALRKVLGS